MDISQSEPPFPFRLNRPLTSEQLHFVYYGSPFLTMVGYGLNIFVCMGLSRTSTIKKPTSTLMFSQMVVNLIAVTCQGIAAPLLVYYRMIDTADNSLSRFVSSVAVFSTYSSLTMIIWVTVNRHIFIWYPLRAERVFSPRVAVVACSTCFLIGTVVATSALFDCCYASYSSTSMTFAFVGPKSLGQYLFAWIYMSLVLFTSFSAYAVLLWKIRKTKRALANHHIAQRRILFGMETRLCLGFGIVALAWFVHLTTLVVPVVAFGYRHPRMSIFYACSRWAMFLVDPFVYLMLTQDLRWATWKCFTDIVSRFAPSRQSRTRKPLSEDQAKEIAACLPVTSDGKETSSSA